MSKPKVYITRKIDEKYLQAYRNELDIHMWEKEEESVPRETLFKEIADADALFAVLSDTIDEEPIRADHPLVGLKNTVCIPHIGSASVETRTKMVQLCLENIQAVVTGEPAITPVS